MEEQKKPVQEIERKSARDVPEGHAAAKPAEKKDALEKKADPKGTAPAQQKQAEKKDPPAPVAKPAEQKTYQEIRDFSIALDNYDDIFSDFDPRQYSRRELSGDFLREVEKRDMEAGGEKIDVLLFLPKEVRNAKNEDIILKRIKEHYAAEIKRVEKKVRSRRHWGVVMTVSGLVLLLIEAFVVSTRAYAALAGLFGALLVPLGWFTMWTGLDRIVQDPDENRKRLEMLERMRRATFVFKAYEDEKKE